MHSPHRHVQVADLLRRSALALAFVLVVGGCSSWSTDRTASTTATRESAPAATETQAAIAPIAEPTSASAALAEPTPVVAAASQTETINWLAGGANWKIDLAGIVDVGPSLSADDPSFPEPGRCYVLVGTLELSALVGGLSPSREEIPSFYLVGGDDAVPFGFANCDRDAIKDAGYQWIRDAKTATEGSLYPFQAHFLVPPDVEITQLSLGKPGEFGTIVLPFEVSESIPPAPDRVSAQPEVTVVPALGVRFEQAAPPSPQDNSTRWSLELAGVVEQTTNIGDKCYLVLGALTAEEVSGGPLSSWPPTFEFVRGQDRSETTFGRCSFSEAAQLGYDWLHNADMLEGASYSFMTTMTLPAGEDPDFLVLRFPSTNEERYLQFETVESVPAAPNLATWASPQEALPALRGATFTEDGYNQWEIGLDGALRVPATGWFDVPGQCILLYGTMTAVASSDPDTLALFRPQFFAIADGVRWLAFGSEQCGAHDLEDAGYRRSRSFDAAVGDAFPFYDVLWVPGDAELDAIVHGLDADHMFSPDIDG